ncbi:MAG: ATP-binding protein [Thermomicrobiales bacterium]
MTVYGVFAEQSLADLDQTIALRSNSFEQLIDRSATPPVLTISVPDVIGDRRRRAASLRGRRLATPGHLTQSATSQDETDLVQSVMSTHQEEVRTIDLSEGEDYRVLARPIGSGADQLILVSGLELSRVNGPLRLLRWILIIAVPLTAAGASLGGYWVATRALQPVSVMSDTARRITEGDLSQRVPGANSGDELGQLATTLNDMIDRIDEMFQRERRFSADASHELRTPLAAIDATIDVTLGRPRDAAGYQEALLGIRTQTGRLAQLTRQLLLLSRLDAAGFRRDFEPVALAELLDAVSQPFREQPGTLSIQTLVDPGPHIVLGDFELLARAFLNIIENAAHHAGDQVTLTIRLTTEHPTQIVTFTDDGSGIPPELAGTAFERFRRGNAARATTGSGLGLSIVQAIVDVHGGRVALDAPETGAGTRVTIWLPEVARKPADRYRPAGFVHPRGTINSDYS